ncbi:MAG: RNA polymerase subunit sigma-70 [Acidimicrobiales bacterium]
MTPAGPDTVVAAAQAGDESAVSELVRRHRNELQVHCYRMLGSFTESEDLVQETFLRAWRGLDRFEGRSTFRARLYRIATNACLDALTHRQRRLLPYDVVPAADLDGPPPEPAEYRSLEPCPDHLLPGEAVVARETIELAFLAAIQHLTPRQRAALIVRDVLGWSARETAELLEISEAAVNSLLQRARPTLRKHLPTPRHEWTTDAELTEAEGVLLRRYIDAHQRAVLREDVRVSYPPYPLWCDSRDDFIEGSRKFAPPGEIRFVATTANRQPAAALCLRSPGDADFRLIALEVLRIEGDQIAEIVDFDLPELFPAFGLPATL